MEPSELAPYLVKQRMSLLMQSVFMHMITGWQREQQPFDTIHVHNLVQTYKHEETPAPPIICGIPSVDELLGVDVLQSSAWLWRDV
jgi:hypothetical protein